MRGAAAIAEMGWGDGDGAVRLLVTGCSRSGTTLMANLIATGFHDVVYPGGEAFPSEDTNGKIHLGKLPSVALEVPRVVADGLHVVFMLRDPRYVLTSIHPKDPGHPWVTAEQWCACAVMWLATASLRTVYRVRYETLVDWPRFIQADMRQWLEVDMRRDFTEAWAHFVDAPDNLDAMGGARPMARPIRPVPAWDDLPAQVRLLADQCGYEVGP